MFAFKLRHLEVFDQNQETVTHLTLQPELSLKRSN